MTDPFNGIFYHIMPSQDSTNIMFYNKPLYNNILTVLSKEFKFPSAEARKFTIKTHVDSKKCNLYIDRNVMTICASGPGHNFWKENNFRKLSENMYKSFVREISTVLNASIDNQDNASQISTQINLSDSNHTRRDTHTTEEVPPAVPATQQMEQVESTQLQDTPVIRQISTLMDMIHTLQGQISTLTNKVNNLVQQAAVQTLYRTVDETHVNTTIENTQNQSEVLQDNYGTNDPGPQNSPVTSSSREAQAPLDLQSRSYSTVVKTSTPKLQKQQTVQRAHFAPRLSRSTNKPTQNPGQAPTKSLQINSLPEQILLIGDSLISAINPKGLSQKVFKNGISGAKINEIYNKVKVFDLNQFSHVVIYVGGNDASNSVDIEYFEEVYDQLIQHVRQINNSCHIFLCNSCPRGDTDTTEVNEAILRLSEQHGISLIDLDKAFHDKDGNVIMRYYNRDTIHLSSSGVKRLVGTINNEVSIVCDFESCVFPSRNQYSYRTQLHIRKRRTENARKRRYGYHTHTDRNSPCYQCGETNHDTNQCRHSEQLKCFHCGFYGHKTIRCIQKQK